jgi:signal transduction histidine kinase
MKWAEDLQNRRLAEAEESRRQQNNFIDITSHEMRNPLSAILQSADDISSSLREALMRPDTSMADVIESCLEAAEIITLCAAHQKSIVDDILTVSKLDSDLLVITPVEAQPIAVVQRAVKMFSAEVQKSSVSLNVCIDTSYHLLGIDWILFDSSRVLQVLINLITNAIKFTQKEDKKSIEVSLQAFKEAPSQQSPEYGYIPKKDPNSDLVFDNNWGSGDIVFLGFVVRDTGRGLTEDEKKVLFTRFSQASPRTHVQYGGSGLGLFISRQITELHGGQIGVASQAGVGSTFSFYIKSRRLEAETSKRVISDPLCMPDPQRDEKRAQEMAEAGKEFLSHARTPTPPASQNAIQLDPKDLYILVVEDNLVNQKVLRKQLQKLGCKVDVANHGKEALDFLPCTNIWKGNESEGQKLSLILMDLEMPVMDGLECVRRIRALEAVGTIFGRIPVVAVTANARQEQIAAAMDAGMVCATILLFKRILTSGFFKDGVVSKPFRIAQLMNKLESLFAGQS